MKGRIYTTFEISRFCSVDISTVMGWVDDGKLDAYRTPGGHRRVSHDDLLSFLEKYRMPVHPLLKKASMRVLIVDDDPVEVRMLRRCLEKMMPVTELDVAHDGFEAGRKLETFQPDLIILDLMLPGIDGFQVCRNIRADEAKKGLKILAISGLRSAETEKKILAMGADAFVAKPFKIDVMRSLVGGLLEPEQRTREKIERRNQEASKTS